MIWLFAGVILAVVSVDLITKFTCDGILNAGIAWGLGAHLPWLWILVVILSLVIVIAATVWYCRTPRKKSYWFTVGLALFIGGVLGNAIDRMLTGGAVHDFLNFIIFKNNIADIALIIGAMMVGGQVAFR